MAKQIVDFIDQNNIYKATISGFRKHHSTETLLMKIRDEVVAAMNKGEVTLATFLDYSKAFDTVDYKTLLCKLRRLGFSYEACILMLSYLSERKQFVQIDEKKSEEESVVFGVPQGSVLGPILFNLYTTDLQEHIKGGKTNQYADDTTNCDHCKPARLPMLLDELTPRFDEMKSWSKKNNLAFNETKTKLMVLSTSRMAHLHNLNDHSNSTFNFQHDGKPIERVLCYKLLGVQLDQHLNWEDNVKKICQSIYSRLYVLRYLRRTATFRIRKQLAESLLLSRLHYCASLFWNLSQFQLQKFDRLKRRICSFVTLKFSTTKDFINLGWLPMEKEIEFNVMKLAHKSMYNENFPSYLKGFENHQAGRETRQQQKLDTNLKVIQKIDAPVT